MPLDLNLLMVIQIIQDNYSFTSLLQMVPLNIKIYMIWVLIKILIVFNNDGEVVASSQIVEIVMENLSVDIKEGEKYIS